MMYIQITEHGLPRGPMPSLMTLQALLTVNYLLTPRLTDAAMHSSFSCQMHSHTPHMYAVFMLPINAPSSLMQYKLMLKYSKLVALFGGGGGRDLDAGSRSRVQDRGFPYAFGAQNHTVIWAPNCTTTIHLLVLQNISICVSARLLQVPQQQQREYLITDPTRRLIR